MIADDAKRLSAIDGYDVIEREQVREEYDFLRFQAGKFVVEKVSWAYRPKVVSAGESTETLFQLVACSSSLPGLRMALKAHKRRQQAKKDL